MSQSATVIATFSRRMQLRLDDGNVVDARIKGKRLRPVCGDNVQAEPIAREDDWLITTVHERANELARPNLRGRAEVLAANIDVLVVVASVLPQPDWFIVDRYLCAAEVMRVDAAVVFNKTDMLEVDGSDPAVPDEYARIGYAVLPTSAKNRSGLPELQKLMAGRTAIIVGQSGVGKSSIINSLIGDERQRTADISGKTREGRHTTVNSVMIELPGGGSVIDSPGVRDYAPALQSANDVELGFREIHDAGHDCKFHNCRHLREPGCAVTRGVEAGTISARRYESYKRTLRLTEDFQKRS